MCGIVGLIARQQAGFFGRDLDIFQTLLVMDIMRGEDSTGVFAVDRNKSVGIMKVASHPMHLFACGDWQKFKQKVNNTGRIIMGHNRKATQGAINSKNAHPFHENNIVLIHNGTLRQDHKKLADVEVDSHAVCHAFNEKGAENVIPTINGAFAFVWWDIAKGKLFAIRNEERPLSLVYTDTTVAVASEAWMPVALYNRERIKIEKVVDLEPGLLYEFDNFGNFTTKKLALFQPPVTTTATQHGGQGGTCMAAWNEGDWTGTDTSKKPTPLTLIKDSRSGEKKSAIETKPNVDDPSFPKGSQVLLNLWEATLERSEGERHVYKLKGKVISPESEMVDAVGFLPYMDGDLSHMELLEAKAVIATVMSTVQSNCGKSIWVKDFKIAPMKSVYNGEIPSMTWEHVTKHGKCHPCGANIFDEEAAITVVTQKVDNKLKVVCCDCTEDKLNGELKDEFIARRAVALQDAVRVRKEADRTDDVPAATTGTPTLH